MKPNVATAMDPCGERSIMDKRELRTYMRGEQGRFLREVDPVGESAVIWRLIESLVEFRDARTVLVYMSLPGEPDTSEFLRKWYGVKRLCIPLVMGDLLQLREYQPDMIVPGYRGIPEPSASAPEVSPSEVDFAIVPGVAFAPSECGKYVRLGHGGGFYDKLLGNLKCPVAGVCHSFRLLDSIPADPWDRSMDYLCCPDCGRI